MHACNLLDGSNSEVIEEVPGLVSDALLTLVILLAGQHVGDEVATSLFLVDVADTSHSLVAHLTWITGI